MWGMFGEFSVSFAETLQKLMDAAKLSQSKLAKQSGLKQTAISKYVLGQRKPGSEALIKLADAFKVSVDELLGEDDMAARPLNAVPLLGLTAAGTPIDPKGDDGDRLSFGDLFRGSVAAFKVQGRSMEKMGVLDGDFVVVRRRPQADSGEVVVAWVDGGVTLKRLEVRKNKHGRQEWWLLPHGHLAKPMMIDPDVPSCVVGVYVGVVRKV